MSGRPIALVGHHHICPAAEGSKPHVGGPIAQPQQSFVRFNGVPIAVRGDKCTCIGPLDTITGGSGLVRINGKAVARIDDATAHGGRIVQGVPSIKTD
ncbi:PAAR domain-containing protein [Inquilinus sp. Marseille-Q2685]|uniref:PAAR domain-containing protein n=1 Tax=Inquilinus sp. Marseille-Q2685 TaxID=2866581 RepID=UPI001CE3E7BC|nr:PAAR domain-containing protein [Inquilinus sp. Marseille-Q2685]